MRSAKKKQGTIKDSAPLEEREIKVVYRLDRGFVLNLMQSFLF
jgi:hypothetical protein